MFAAAEQARANARVFPRLGRFLAALDVPEDSPIQAERTGKAEGHYTLWAEAGALLARVVAVLPV